MKPRTSTKLSCFNHSGKIDLPDRKWWGQWTARIWKYVDPTHTFPTFTLQEANTAKKKTTAPFFHFRTASQVLPFSFPGIEELFSQALGTITWLAKSEELHVIMCDISSANSVYLFANIYTKGGGVLKPFLCLLLIWRVFHRTAREQTVHMCYSSSPDPSRTLNVKTVV